MRENTGMISEAKPKPGRASTYTSGWPKNQKKCCHITAEAPAWVSKKCAPRKRSSINMIWAAESGGRMIKVRAEMVSISQTRTGMRPSVMPGPRMVRIVTSRLTAVAIVPSPVTRSARFQ